MISHKMMSEQSLVLKYEMVCSASVPRGWDDQERLRVGVSDNISPRFEVRCMDEG